MLVNNKRSTFLKGSDAETKYFKAKSIIKNPYNWIGNFRTEVELNYNFL